MNVFTSEVEMLRAQCREWEKVCDQHLRHIKKLKKERTWVGLTDEDITEVWRELKSKNEAWSDLDFARAIEAKLKEKNT